MHRLRSNACIAFSAVSVAALIALTPWAARAQMPPAAPAQSSGGASVGAGALTMQSDGSAAQVVYGDIRSPYRLSIVQLCSPNNGKCTLAFVDTRDGDDAAALVRDYYRRTGGKATPNVSTQATCASGWIASAMAEQGSVAAGGISRGQAEVCGYVSAPAALKAVLDACDAQTAGGCRQATRINVVWGYWDGLKPNGRETDPGRPYEAATHSGGGACDSTLPLVESPACKAQAAVQLRAAGMP